MGSIRAAIIGALLSSFVACPALAGGPFGIDHPTEIDGRGIWKRSRQVDLEAGAIVVELAAALWAGSDDKFGRTAWAAVDSTAVSALTALALKRAFGRARPNQGGDPNRWFKGSCCDSFPSGEVTLQASFVTPYIANYAGEAPGIWALELLPAYDAIARVKSGEHWQSDVIAGWALGSAIGYWAAKRDVPLSVQVLPKGLTIGFAKRF